MKIAQTSKLVISLLLISLISACSLRKPHKETFNEKQLKQQEERMAAGQAAMPEMNNDPTGDPIQASLWAKSIGSPYIIRNQKAQKVGDLLNIQIVENATASTKAKTDAKREGSVSISGSLSAGQGSSDQMGTLTAQTGNKNDFKGEGQTDRSGRFETTVQAVVENVLPNGTLFVRGHKALTINNEDQEVEISGFVRPDDIRINNTIVSTLMADAQIRYIGEGMVSDKQKAGWGARLIDAVWPF